MTASHLRAAERRALAPEALAQREARARAYPAATNKAKAEADWQAWTAIHLWLSEDSLPGWIEWPQVIAAADLALSAGRRAMEQTPDDASLAGRCARVAEIADMLKAHRAFLVAETERYRPSIAGESKAA